MVILLRKVFIPQSCEIGGSVKNSPDSDVMNVFKIEKEDSNDTQNN